MARGVFLRVVAMLASALGVVALWLPFTWGISPLGGLELATELDAPDDVLMLAIAVPALLALPIALWNLARLARPETSAAERTAAYALSTLAMLAFVLATALSIVDRNLMDPQTVVALAVAWIALAVNLALLARNRRRGISSGVVAEIFLLLGYPPAMLFALLVFADRGIMLRSPDGLWDIGGWAVLATCGLYVAQTVLRLRQADAQVYLTT